MSRAIDVPPEVTDATGLTSWPDRGSTLAADFEMTWQHARRRVEIRYEPGDALWLVAEYDGRHEPERRVSAELHPRADRAYEAALGILVTPLP
jgi:1,2-phenylacetyl-CoA epoxidase PaaB subunit